LSVSPRAARIRRATAIGASAILIWSSLALLASSVGAIPPFQLVAMAFTLAFAVGVAGSLALGRDPIGPLRQPLRVWLIGIVGLFGYHLFYFLSLRLAPPIEANLLNYLWPLLIVLFSALLPGERLTRAHLLGALAGLLGTALLVTGGQGVAVRAEAVPGYLAAVACAVIWAGYTVLSRRFGSVPTEAVGGFCLATAVLALLCHLSFETTVVPRGWEWAAIAAMGIGPVGGAFFIWDHGVKHGDIQALGTLAYATPLLSTALLILAGRAESTWVVWLACALIISGALIASHSLLRPRKA